MMNDEGRTVTAPGVSAEIGEQHIVETRQATSSSALVSFESVKHLFSDKPLRRPSRTRPLDVGRTKKKKK